jgi:hypothetical protein
MAQYAIFLYSPSPGSSEPAPEYDDHSDDLARSGAMVAAFALEPSDTATSLRADTVTDGPFMESKEVIAGFYVIEAPDLGAALDIARRNPILRHGGGLEVRPVAGGIVVPK